MAGIYIHIPFCRQACYYCNFHFATSLRKKEEMIKAITEEIRMQQGYTGDEPVETIYFGGGTPSLLNIEELMLISDEIRAKFPVAADAEITLEANPDDITAQKLEEWKTAGINRLSIGIQSFFDEDLQWMNRSHNAEQAINTLQMAIRKFTNITADLIYGIPGLTDERWKQNVDTLIQTGVPHLSCYALTVEPQTPLDKLIRLQQKAPVDADKQSSQFLLLMEWMEVYGYEQYEISNFAKPGMRSRHNSSYWSAGAGGQRKKYLGLGPSAHSYNGNTRQWNVSNNAAYIGSIWKGVIPFEKEELTSTQKLNEYIMTALRTKEGISLEYISTAYKTDAALLLAKAKKFSDNGLLLNKNNSLLLTKEGKLLADGIAADLFF